MPGTKYSDDLTSSLQDKILDKYVVNNPNLNKQDRKLRLHEEYSLQQSDSLKSRSLERMPTKDMILRDGS